MTGYYNRLKYLSQRWQLRIVLLIFISFGCIDKLVLPEDLNTAETFSAGDTTYLQVNPVWDESYGLVTPIDLSIAADGRVFIADSALNSILVFAQSGNNVPGFEALQSLQDTSGRSLIPIDVDVDQKLNVMFTNGSHRIYRWNQYWNEVGIDSSAVSALFTQDDSGDTITVRYGSLLWLQLINDRTWTPSNFEWVQDAALIDSLLAPHLFYDGSFLINKILDRYYDSQLTSFSSLTTVGDTRNHLFTTDQYNNRIVEIAYAYNTYIQLKDGHRVWAHQGLFYRTVEGPGTGAGTVNDPLGIDVDYEDNIYYTQQGEVFGVHKIKPDPFEGFSKYVSAFQLYHDDIMDIDRFIQPQDIAVDNNQMIYVSNTGAGEIQVFKADGSYFKKAGVEEFRIDFEDWVPGDTTLFIIDSTDTYYIAERKGMLIKPAGITVDDRGVIYVCDPDQSSIFRFRLSNVLDEDIQPE
ncbi:MAG: hypothetical protein H8E14_04305 [Candidatus Marinimicrobia bacterium]|nr:hypothetical protein [Candidatus Neomarinimicrobiota bacterium]